MISDEALTFFEELAQSSPLLDSVEILLRQSGEDELADKLNKFQQDAALEFEWAICGKEDAPSGEATAKLWKAYAEITTARFSVFYHVVEVLENSELKGGMLALIAKIPSTPNEQNSVMGMRREI